MISKYLKERIRSEAPLAEQQGKLTEQQLAIIYENRWFHLLVPKVYGGEEMNLPDFALFMEELASIDGAFAWNVNLGAGANLFAGYMDGAIAKHLFLDPRTCIAGSGMVTGRAKKVGNQFEIEGHWKYASGSAHATFFSLNAIMENEEEQVFSSFIVPADQVKVINTWKTTGLKATASHDFKVESCLVPAGYSFSLLHPSLTHDGLLYRFSFQILAEINMLVMTTGLAMRFLELAKEVARQKRLRDQDKGLAECSGFKAMLEQKEHAFRSSRRDVFSSLTQLWNKTERGEGLSDEEGKVFTRGVLDCAKASRDLVDALYPFMGMHVVFESLELNRVWRDFKTASQHALLAPDPFSER